MDVLETLKGYLETMPDATGLHIGEVIPQEYEGDFIWLEQSSEETSDDLCVPQTIDTIRVDAEIVSEDINHARDWAATTKNHLRAYPINSLKFENDKKVYQYIHGIDVDDHDNEYQTRSVESDAGFHIGALDITINLGDLV